MRGDTLQTALSVFPETLKGRLLFVRAEAPSNERSHPVGQRNVGDSIGRRDVGGRAAVHRTYGTEAASSYPAALTVSARIAGSLSSRASTRTNTEAIRAMMEKILHILSKDPGEKLAKKAKRK
jgi:hypothetical protein